MAENLIKESVHEAEKFSDFMKKASQETPEDHLGMDLDEGRHPLAHFQKSVLPSQKLKNKMKQERQRLRKTKTRHASPVL